MVLKFIGEKLKPEEAEGGQQAPLIGNAVGHDAVEGADSIGGNDQQGVAEIVNIAHFSAPAVEREIGLEEGITHSGHGRARVAVVQGAIRPS